ncbi:MAG: RNA pseudouridine synthase [Deltaproteobacteria bacterium]|nr:MAG: RNA pseudouridine synthase [Deltaproteobacteria bacterium]
MPVSHVTISAEEAGQKLVPFLQRRLGKTVPRSALMRVIRKGQVRVDGKRAKPFDRIARGQVVRIPPFAQEQADRISCLDQHGDLPLLAEDRNMLVVNKPAGLPVHPGTGWTDSVVTRLQAMFPDAPFAPTPVHRLDKNTSGILVVARAYGFLRDMQQLWQQGQVDKVYLAWVQGRWPTRTTMRLTDRLTKSGGKGQEKMRVGSGKSGVCEVWPLRVGREASLMAVRLLTGRTHQIRVQMASRGFPLIGDPKYKGPRYPTMLLHAWRLSWPHHVFSLLPSWTGAFAVDHSLVHDTNPLVAQGVL